MSKHKIDEEYLRSLIEKVLAEKHGPAPREGLELTPDPTRSKKRRYFRATLTIDEELWKLVQEECDRLRILPPKFIDSLIWNYFRKPPLSHEKDESSK